MQLHAITHDRAIYTSASGAIIAEPITQGARAVLEWYFYTIPANDNTK